MKIPKVLIVLALMFSVALVSLKAEAASTLPTNTLFTLKGSKVVYYVAGDAVAYPFPNEQVFLSWFPSFDKVKTYDKKEVKNTLSKTFVTAKPGARVIKFGNDPKLYAVSKGARLNWIMNEKALVEIFGANWRSYFINLPAASISDYSISDKIEKGNQYSRATQRSYNTITQELNRLKVLKKDFIDGEGNTIPLLKTLTENGSGSLSPKFSSKTFAYTYKLNATEENVTFTPTAFADFMKIKVKDYPVESGKGVKIDIPGGTTEVPVEVSLPNGRFNTYLVTVTRPLPNGNSRLSSLTENLSRSLRPLFNANTFDYELTALESEDTITIKAKPANSAARIVIDGIEYTPNTSYNKDLRLGANTIDIQVIAADGTVTRYTIKIQKPV